MYSLQGRDQEGDPPLLKEPFGADPRRCLFIHLRDEEVAQPGHTGIVSNE
jgi:hypothetical protein